MKTKLLFIIAALITGLTTTFAQPGSIDTSFNPTDIGFSFGNAANATIETISIQSDGKIMIGGGFTSYNGTGRKYIARLNADGSLDASFNPGTGANGDVRKISIQSDGKIMIGGSFTSYNGTGRNYIARLNADGSLDASFNPGTGANGSVRTISIQSNGKIIIGGSFTSYNGTGRNYIARLNADGSLDASFNPGTGANGDVRTISIQSDGRIMIGGGFTSYNGTGRNYIARLNADGSLDASFNPGTGANSTVYSTSIQSNGKIIIGGEFTSYNGTGRNYIARLNADGSLDASFNPGTGANNSVYSISIQSDGKIIIGGTYNGTSTNRIARLNADGSLDASFNPGTGANTTVNSTSIQSDGKIIIGGGFSSYNGTSRNYIARLNADGILDASFNPGTGANSTVWTTSIQSNGKIIIGGYFTSYNGTVRNYIARLNADGSLDTSFNQGTGVGYIVFSTSIQSDGKIIIGGYFNSYNGTGRICIARLNADGSLDSSFNPGTGAKWSVESTSIQSNGKIIIGGGFTSYNGTGRNYIARLNADGSLDASFNPGTGANRIVWTTSIQSNGKIIIGGEFTSYNGTGRNYIARLNADGSLDASFNPGTGANNFVYSTSIQSNGKIIIGGEFTSYNGTGRNYIARLNADGSLDSSFNPGTGANGTVWKTTIQSDGKIIIGGNFTSYNGTVRNYIARLNADGSLDSSFNPGTGANSTVWTTSIQSDGKIIIGGNFTSYNGTGRNRIARINGVCVPPAPPTGSASHTFCNAATVANLTATGSNIQWYAASSGGSALAGTTALVNGNSYYASQTVSGCESATRFEVAVTINAPAAPTGSASQTFCNAATVADLTATGSNIQWYADSSSGSALAGTTVLVDGNSYYASQILSGCESATRFEVAVTINAVDISVTPTGGSLTANASGATYQWLDCDNNFAVISGATNQTYTPKVTGNYSVAVTQNGCTDTSLCYNVTVLGTGIVEVTQNGSVIIYPNPFTSQTVLQTDNVLINAKLIISNVLGQTVMELNNISGQTIILQRNNLPVGQYFLRLTEDNKQIATKKIIIVD
ncbi:MAG: T9SS type A sorting domain-containing protein [Bacteroidia bacterium]